MATLIDRDTSGVLKGKPGEVEVQRTRSAKKWLVGTLPDGRRQYRVGSSIGPLHYRVDPFDETEAWKEIDLTIRPVTGKGWQHEVTSNGYQVRIWQRYTMPWHYTAEFKRAGEWVRMAPVELRYVNAAGEQQSISKPTGGMPATVDNDAYTVTWQDAFGTGLHFRYNISPDQFAKTVVIDNAAALPAATIGSEGLRVEIVMALAWSGQAGNGFGKGRDLSVLKGQDDGEEERHHRFGKHPHLRQDGLAALWMAEPRAWDAQGADLPMEWGLERKGKRVFGAFGVAVADLAGAAWPVSVDTAITEEQVGASSDDTISYDATYPGTTPAPALNSTNYTMGATTSAFRLPGFRFTTVPVPQGATIDSAAIALMAHQTLSYACNVTIYAEDVDDAGTFATTVPKRQPYDAWGSKTTASAQWAIGTTTWSVGTYYASTDCGSVIEEVVGRAGWSADNAIVIIVANTSTSLPAANGYRSFRMWDYAGNASGAKFNCTYTETSGETVTATRALGVFASGTAAGTRTLGAFGSAAASATRSLAVTGAALVTALRSLAASGSADAATTRTLETYASDLQAAVRDVATYGTATEAGTRAAEVLGQVTVEATRLVETWASETAAAALTAETWASDGQDATRSAEAWASDTQADEAAAEAWGEETLADTAPAEAWGEQSLPLTVATEAWGSDAQAATVTAEAYGAASQVATLAAEVYGIVAASALREVATYGADTQAASRLLEVLGSTALLATMSMEVWGAESGPETIAALREMAAWGTALLQASRALAAYGAEALDATRPAEAWASDEPTATAAAEVYGTQTDTGSRIAEVYAFAAASALRQVASYGAATPSATLAAEVWGWAQVYYRNFRFQALPGRFSFEALPERFTLQALPERFTIEALPGRFTFKALPGRFTKEAL